MKKDTRNIKIQEMKHLLNYLNDLNHLLGNEYPNIEQNSTISLNLATIQKSQIFQMAGSEQRRKHTYASLVKTQNTVQ